jgi:hypothetical protein
MEDAYEIGIRLVLENGVSAGIAVLQNDLAAYDRALTATTGRLRTVAEAGRALAAPMVSVGMGPVARSAATEQGTESPDAEQRCRPEATVPALAVPLPAAKLPQAVAASVPAMPRVSSVGRTSGTPVWTPRLPAASEHPARAAPTPQGATPPGRGRAMTAVTVMTVPPPRYAQYAPSFSASRPPALAAPEMPDGRPVSMPASDQRQGRPAPFPVRALFGASPLSAAPPGAEPVLPAVQAAPRPASAPAALATPAAPVAAAASSGPVQGDVFLDGARVGRWMSDRLAREADRPQAGMTGFDPRLGPAWPGSLHGT